MPHKEAYDILLGQRTSQIGDHDHLFTVASAQPVALCLTQMIQKLIVEWVKEYTNDLDRSLHLS